LYINCLYKLYTERRQSRMVDTLICALTAIYARGNGTKIVSRVVHDLPSSKSSLQSNQV